MTIGVLKIRIQDTHILLSLLNIMINQWIWYFSSPFYGERQIYDISYIIIYHVLIHLGMIEPGPLLRHDPVSYTLDRNAAAEDPWGSDDLASASTPSGWVLLGWGMSPPNI